MIHPPKDHYVWLLWSAGFLLPWAVMYWRLVRQRHAMLVSSLLTAPMGLTEPIFVPAYWSPPSLFDLAQRTGFDIESVIFCFAIGGIGVVLYNAATGAREVELPVCEHRSPRHRFHRLAVAAPFLAFPPLYLLPWDPIYAGIAAMALGGVATILCRPDLLGKTLWGGTLFLGLYAVFLVGIELIDPGYIARVWNLPALSGVLVWRAPVEEYLFAFSFGMMWSGIYEHLTWRTLAAPGRMPPVQAQ